MRSMPIRRPTSTTDETSMSAAVSRLSYRQRSVLYLLYWEDRSVLDVANIWTSRREP